VNEHREHKPALTRRDPLPEYVAATKGSAVYQVHTYPTKIPPQAIIPFIEASTEAGGVVADPFAGSGMTGVASLLSGRSAVLSDLSPGAVHLARNHTRRVEPLRLR
jgi:DNA modification methylase